MAIECRLCSSTEIYCYPADAPDQAICEECCSHAVHLEGDVGHDYERCDGEWSCKYCGAPPSHEWLDDYYSEP